MSRRARRTPPRPRERQPTDSTGSCPAQHGAHPRAPPRRGRCAAAAGVPGRLRGRPRPDVQAGQPAVPVIQEGQLGHQGLQGQRGHGGRCAGLGSLGGTRLLPPAWGRPGGARSTCSTPSPPTRSANRPRPLPGQPPAPRPAGVVKVSMNRALNWPAGQKTLCGDAADAPYKKYMVERDVQVRWRRRHGGGWLEGCMLLACSCWRALASGPPAVPGPSGLGRLSCPRAAGCSFAP